MRNAIGLTSIVVAGVITGGFNMAVANQSVALDEMNFNYQVDPQKGTKPSWYPLSVFSDGNKTYIEFPKNVNARNMPEIYVKPVSETEGVPIWRWNKSYLIINQDVKGVKLVKGSDVVMIKNTQNPYQYIAPPPKYLAKYYQGPIIYLFAGIAQNDSASFSSFSTKLSFEYNWALSRHWLLGLGLGGYYMPSTGATSSDHKSLQKYGADVYAKGSYLFFNGLYLSATTGVGYSRDEWTDKSTDEETSKSGLQPEVGLGMGYLITQKFSLDLNANYMFKGGGLFSNISVLIGMGYHF
ncbi:TrbG/VirB9 family P-type conjugative transfer protein [Thiotrichales bacterium 19S3-7]|nr:TrbG/VirB9 family P-type conjugative transfer protein [Thiotrichales bacterium 19S3-7]MCF6802656.1 TrbG/VirB9 family P-type conjugative transfer protein [Thiotrichales bacterium 19S3-11]